MNDSKSKASATTSSGIGVFGLLTLLFVTLKVTGEHFHTPVADWSWWLVLSPLWGGFAFFLFLLVAWVVLCIVVEAL